MRPAARCRSPCSQRRWSPALVALKNGHTAARIRDAAIGGVISALGAVFILLAVGALIGAWNMAGTIPTVVYYGVGLLNETWFYPATAIICGLVGPGHRQLVDDRGDARRRLRGAGAAGRRRSRRSPPAPSSPAPTSATR